MQRWVVALVLAGFVGTTPVWAHSSKRTDACGCHHQWGLRHCHPAKKTVSCEAPATAEKPSGKPAKPPAQKEPAKKPASE
ncbi:MAG: hypothetical protein WBV82_22795 [Myxococcaceae bacterium]